MVVTLPILPTDLSQNHKLPSGPAAICSEPELAVGIEYSVTAPLVACAVPSSRCFRFDDPAGTTLPGGGIPAPSFAPNFLLPGQGSIEYRVSVIDAAQNRTSPAGVGVFPFKFDYFVCSQARATAATSGHGQLSTITTCASASCHNATQTGGSPVATYVPVPKTSPAYWCRKP